MTAVGLAVVQPSAGERFGSSRGYRWLLGVAGALGLAASALLTVDKLRLLANPNYVPSCNINPVISCGSVMRTEQASLLGFPNSLLGLVGFAVVLATGAALAAGAVWRRWYWLGLQAGALLGVVLVHWLIWQSLYSIGALCPYCMVVWAVTILLFWYTTLANLRSGALPVPGRLAAVVRELDRYHWAVPVLWYGVIALLVLNRFWYYWQTLG
ncbi:vitamin K epoxide reductase [Streptomyces tateyamensis]|uniref:Vitamin K epoxide reductase n=1 Tax=Streptomyces tateyamensis TaxID=565073 RepID=A0A2V4N0F9_9ACTN|nr:vitamin K epoxide reductase family protein [Streptomyces tateyamensis]PYC66781.1 vitamin K epoxide reductase [Streptomyces tateyamensis]